MCMLHGVTMLQVEAMPTCGLEKSSSLKPTGYSIARLGARLSPSRTIEENRRATDFAERLTLIGWTRLKKPVPASKGKTVITASLSTR